MQFARIARAADGTEAVDVVYGAIRVQVGVSNAVVVWGSGKAERAIFTNAGANRQLKKTFYGLHPNAPDKLVFFFEPEINYARCL